MKKQDVQQAATLNGVKPCAHGRLINDVFTRMHRPTGKVCCLECGAVFDPPVDTIDTPPSISGPRREL